MPASSLNVAKVEKVEAVHKDTHDVVRDLIRSIQSCGLSVGDRLPSIRQLAETFQTSASVVRDSLMQLQTMGLVKILPRSGAFIQTVDYRPLVAALTETLEGALMQADHNLFHLLEARELIEVECAMQAARRRRPEDLLPVREALEEMDELLARMHPAPSNEVRLQLVEADVRYHLGIARVAGNPVQATILRALLGLIRPHLVRLPWTAERKRVAHRAHLELYDALLEGDAEKAGACMEQHLKLAYKGLLEKVWSKPRDGSAGSQAGNGAAHRKGV